MAGSQGTEFSYIGKGSVYLKVKGSTDPMRPVGNVSALSLKANEDKKSQLDFQNAGGGEANSLRRISSVELSITMVDFVAENIGLAVRGSVTAVAGGTVAEEAVVAYLGGLTPLAHVNPTSVVVKDVTDVTTYVAGTDYDVTAGGLFIPTGSSIDDGDTLHVAYSYAGENLVQALTDSGQDYVLRFVGLNEAKSGKPTVVQVHRARFGPVQDMALIGDDYASIALTADALKDTDITTVGLSQYFTYANQQ